MSTVTFPWQHNGLHSKGKIRVFLPQDVLNIFKFASFKASSSRTVPSRTVEQEQEQASRTVASSFARLTVASRDWRLLSAKSMFVSSANGSKLTFEEELGISSILYQPRTENSVGGVSGCHAGGREFDSGRTNT